MQKSYACALVTHPLILSSSYSLILYLLYLLYQQADEEINFSQTSEASEVSLTNPTKRAKKYSVIRDPIYMNAAVRQGMGGMGSME
jgi:hypothetical protein